MDESLWIGLMSGTSADGIDAALVRFEPRMEVLASETRSYPDALREQLLELAQGARELSLDAIAELDHQVGACFADAALRMLERAQHDGGQVAAIGSHGQTLRHRPQGKHPFTLQIGDPNLISERCGCTVVADFRRRDVAAGGQGAPLLPALHAAMFADAGEARAVLNLGGIANLTLLPVDAEVRGFDTGPANCLLDAWCAEQTGSAFDRDGGWAASGKVVDALLAACLEEPWFALGPPKSTGREMFHLDWLRQRWPGLATLAAADVQSTLLALTVRSVAEALRREQPDTRRLLVCGGGVHNPQLLHGLRTLLPGVSVESTARHGVDPDSVEAAGFAWLARERLAGRPGNLPSVTGAAGPRVLGAIYSA